MTYRSAYGAAFLVAALCAGPSAADDFNSVMSTAKSSGTVRVMVSGWQAITGDEEHRTSEELLNGVPYAAKFRDSVMRAASASGGAVSDVQTYEFLPIVSMEADQTALQTIQDANPNAEVWHDQINTISLGVSTKQTGATSVWSGGFKGKDQMVAVIDTGVDRNHPFLRGKVVREACFSARCPNGKRRMEGKGASRPVHMHGTHVAGISAGNGNGLSGVAPAAKIIGINVFGATTMKSRDSDIMAGLDYVARLRIREKLPIAAVNMSLGGNRHFRNPCASSPYERASRFLNRYGVVIVAAAGNAGNANGVVSPACAPSIVSVGAIDGKNQVAKFSNSAAFLHILAPGVKINSANWKKGSAAGYIKVSGTSMAAPHVAGAIAVLRSAQPTLTAAEIRETLKRAGTKVKDRRNGVRTPRLDLVRALDSIDASARKAVPPKRAQPAKAKPRPVAKPAPRPTVQPRPARPAPKPAPADRQDDGWQSITGD